MKYIEDFKLYEGRKLKPKFWQVSTKQPQYTYILTQKLKIPEDELFLYFSSDVFKWDLIYIGIELYEDEVTWTRSESERAFKDDGFKFMGLIMIKQNPITNHK